MKNEFSVMRVKTSTLERIRYLAKIRDTSPPKMIDELVLDYEMDLRALAEDRATNKNRIEQQHES